MLRYLGLLYPNNCDSLRRLHHSLGTKLILLLYLPSPRISFTLNSKPSSLINPFLFSLFALTLVGSLVPWPSKRFSSHCHFHSVVHYRLVHLCQCRWVSVHRLYSCLARFIYRHSKSLHSSSYSILSGEIIIIIISHWLTALPTVITAGWPDNKAKPV